MKGRIWKDERWPDYGVSTNEPFGIEIPQTLYERYMEISEEYSKVQKELASLYVRQGQSQ